ncbi:MAG: aldo/keto reductase [Desulfobacter sp.]|nr:MAG: aldo/keto reductase [Desulfobacter sp.]
MDSDFRISTLGKTGLKVSRLGLAGSYGAPARTYEKAFEQGCNYFYSGSGRKRSAMKKAIRTLVAQGHRDKMVISIQTYARMGMMTKVFFKQALSAMNIDYADILMLGWHNSPPAARLMDFAMEMKEKGLARFIGLSGHNRGLFKTLADDPRFDLFHIRYNPAHQGAAMDCFPAFEKENPPGLVTYTATRWGHLLSQRQMPKGQAPLKARDCYRFSLSDPRVNICLCGPKNMDQMTHALTALEKGPLLPEEKEHITRIGNYVHDKSPGFFS